MRPLLEYVSVMWDPCQQHLKSALEMVQRRLARRILHDFSSILSASSPVARLHLENLESRRTSDKVCMMCKIMNGLVDVNPADGLLKPRNCRSREHKYHLQVSHSRTDTCLHSYFPSAIRLWSSVPTGAPSAMTLLSFRSTLTDWMIEECAESRSVCLTCL